MNLVWSLFTGFVLVAAVATGVYYFIKRRRGKSYLAVSTTSAIVAIWVSYAALLSINWPTVIVAIVLRNDPDKVVLATQPSWITLLGGLPVAVIACYIVYRLAMAELRANRLPLNASAREIEEPGRSVSIFELAAAHARYKLSGRLDEPLGNPGEDPFRLPELPLQREWPSLAADLLVQIEPNLQRESFRTLSEKTFFTLSEIDIREPDRKVTWIVRAVHEAADLDAAVVAFGNEVGGGDGQNARLLICIRSAEHIDKHISAQGLLVRVLSLGAMIEKTLNLYEYASALIRRFEQSPVPGTSFTLKDSFVPLQVNRVSPGDRLSEFDEGETPQDLLQLMATWTTEPGVDHLSIIGEFGQGKSTVLLAFCAQWARRWLNGERGERIPLLIELRGKSPRRQSPDRFLAEWGDRYGLRGNPLLSLIQAGRSILIFEGFDEVQDAGLRFDRFEQFKALWAFSYPGSKIVFTGRPNFFLDTAEREKLLRSSRVARDAGLENTLVLSILFLGEKEISKALRGYPSRVRKEIILACRNDPAFLNIAKRPSMLPVIGNQWPRIKEELSKRGGITSASIIRYFIDFLYARKEADPERLGEYKLLHRKVRHYFTQRIAWKMTSLRSRNTIDIDNFVRAIEEAYIDLDAEFRMDSESDPEVASSIARLREMFKARPHAELIAHIAGDVRGNGLFVPDPAGGRDNLYFPHKQYFEFVLAEILVGAIDISVGSRSWASRLSRSELVGGMIFEPVSLFFAAGLIDPDKLSRGDSRFFTKIQGNLLGLAATMMLALLSVTPGGRRDLGARLVFARRAPMRWRGLFHGIRGREVAQRRLSHSLALMMMTMMAIATAVVVTRPVTGESRVGVFSIPFVSLIMAFIPMSMTALLVLSRTAMFNIDACFLYMEAYRTGGIERARRDFGETSHAALLCLLQSSLPIGAVDLPQESLADALAKLGLQSVSDADVDRS
jgi:hypothetical protein